MTKVLYNILGSYSADTKSVKAQSSLIYLLTIVKFDYFVEPTEKKTDGVKV